MKTSFYLMTLPILSLACSTIPVYEYPPSLENVTILKENHTEAKLKITSISLDVPFPECRLAGPFVPIDGLSIPEYIAKAFNDEFKLAGIYSEDKIEIAGKITDIAFQSSNKSPFWEISLELNSSNGQTLSVKNKRQFKRSFTAQQACEDASTALRALIKDLITQSIKHPKFDDLLK